MFSHHHHAVSSELSIPVQSKRRDRVNNAVRASFKRDLRRSCCRKQVCGACKWRVKSKLQQPVCGVDGPLVSREMMPGMCGCSISISRGISRGKLAPMRLLAGEQPSTTPCSQSAPPGSSGVQVLTLKTTSSPSEEQAPQSLCLSSLDETLIRPSRRSHVLQKSVKCAKSEKSITFQSG